MCIWAGEGQERGGVKAEGTGTWQFTAFSWKRGRWSWILVGGEGGEEQGSQLWGAVGRGREVAWQLLHGSLGLGLLEDLVSTRHVLCPGHRGDCHLLSLGLEKVRKSATTIHLGHQLPTVAQSWDLSQAPKHWICHPGLRNWGR